MSRHDEKTIEYINEFIGESLNANLKRYYPVSISSFTKHVELAELLMDEMGDALAICGFDINYMPTSQGSKLEDAIAFLSKTNKL